MTTFQAEWQHHRDTMYPDGVHADQNKECHQAFMAGAMNAIKLVTEAAGLPEEQAVVEVEKLKRELVHIAATQLISARTYPPK